MSKRGLPTGIKMRHDSHYVEELTKNQRSVGRVIPIDKIAPNPEQPRVEIGDLTELSASIKQNGVLEPLLVKPKGDGTWMIIAGERRWHASNIAGLEEVPCIELDIDEKSIAEIALIENLQRKDLTVWEEADGLAYLGERFGYTHEEIAGKIGKSRTTVTESMAIAGLPDSIRQKCLKAKITAKSALLEIARQFDEKAMHDFLDTIESLGLKREEIRQTARPNKKGKENLIISPERKAKTNDNLFKFNSDNREFYLEIRFDKTEPFDKRDVLLVLKEVFEKIKAD